jgi:hypothetical protein
MTAGILPVQAPAAVVGIDLTRPTSARVGPVRQPPIPDPAKDLVEVGFGNQSLVVPPVIAARQRPGGGGASRGRDQVTCPVPDTLPEMSVQLTGRKPA